MPLALGMFAAAAILALLGVPVAEAALPPHVYAQAREQATYHVQVKVTRVTPPAKTPGECETTGDVVRIFRDKSATLRPGARLAFNVSCSRRGDPPLIGGTLWTDYDALMRARYLEVFLNQSAGRYQVALSQSRIIEAPTEQPVMGPASAAPAEKGWQADFTRWYREIQRDAARSRDDLCSSKYEGHATRIQNCRAHGMNDTEERIRKGASGF